MLMNDWLGCFILYPLGEKPRVAYDCTAELLSYIYKSNIYI